MANIKFILLVDLDEQDDDRAEAAVELPCNLEVLYSAIHVERIEVETSDTLVVYYRRV